MDCDYRPMNISALMDQALELYKVTFKSQIAFSLFIGIISFIILMPMAFGMFLVLGQLMDLFIIGSTGMLTSSLEAMLIIIVFIISIIPVYRGWMYLLDSGYILISKQAFYNESASIPFKEIFKVFLRVMSVAMAHMILFIPWLIIIGFIVYPLLYVGVYFSFEVLVLIALVYSLFYLPYSNLLALSVPVAIFEDRFFFSAVVRSFKLIKGDFWKILSARLLWMFIAFLFSYSIQSLLGVLVIVAFGNVDSAFITGFGFMQVYVFVIAAVLTAPMSGILTALIYFNQRIKIEGLDIEIGIGFLTREYEDLS